jgi:hypothetical protein
VGNSKSESRKIAAEKAMVDITTHLHSDRDFPATTVNKELALLGDAVHRTFLLETLYNKKCPHSMMHNIALNLCSRQELGAAFMAYKMVSASPLNNNNYWAEKYEEYLAKVFLKNDMEARVLYNNVMMYSTDYIDVIMRDSFVEYDWSSSNKSKNKKQHSEHGNIRRSIEIIYLYIKTQLLKTFNCGNAQYLEIKAKQHNKNMHSSNGNIKCALCSILMAAKNSNLVPKCKHTYKFHTHPNLDQPYVAIDTRYLGRPFQHCSHAFIFTEDRAYYKVQLEPTKYDVLAMHEHIKDKSQKISWQDIHYQLARVEDGDLKLAAIDKNFEEIEPIDQTSNNKEQDNITKRSQDSDAESNFGDQLSESDLVALAKAQYRDDDTESTKSDTSNKLPVKHSAIAKTAVEQFPIKEFLTQNQQEYLISKFPYINFKFEQKLAHSHPISAIERRVVEDLVIKNLKPNIKIIDIGGNPVRHYGRGRKNIHSCCPILDEADEVRSEHNASMPAASYCDHTVQDCTCFSPDEVDIYLSVQSIYYISPEDIVDLVHESKGRKLIAIVHNFDNIHGKFNMDECTYRSFRCPGHEDRWISMSVNGNVSPYEHSACDWLQQRKGYNAKNGRCIVWDYRTYGSVRVYTIIPTTTITKISTNKLPLSTAMNTLTKENEIMYRPEQLAMFESNNLFKAQLQEVKYKLINWGKLVYLDDDEYTTVEKTAIYEVSLKLAGKERNKASFQLAYNYAVRALSKHAITAEDATKIVALTAAIGLVLRLETDLFVHSTIVGSVAHQITNYNKSLNPADNQISMLDTIKAAWNRIKFEFIMNGNVVLYRTLNSIVNFIMDNKIELAWQLVEDTLPSLGKYGKLCALILYTVEALMINQRLGSKSAITAIVAHLGLAKLPLPLRILVHSGWNYGFAKPMKLNIYSWLKSTIVYLPNRFNATFMTTAVDNTIRNTNVTFEDAGVLPIYPTTTSWLDMLKNATSGVIATTISGSKQVAAAVKNNLPAIKNKLPTAVSGVYNSTISTIAHYVPKRVYVGISAINETTQKTWSLSIGKGIGLVGRVATYQKGLLVDMWNHNYMYNIRHPLQSSYDFMSYLGHSALGFTKQVYYHDYLNNIKHPIQTTYDLIDLAANITKSVTDTIKNSIYNYVPGVQYINNQFIKLEYWSYDTKYMDWVSVPVIRLGQIINAVLPLPKAIIEYFDNNCVFLTAVASGLSQGSYSMSVVILIFKLLRWLINAIPILNVYDHYCQMQDRAIPYYDVCFEGVPLKKLDVDSFYTMPVDIKCKPKLAGYQLGLSFKSSRPIVCRSCTHNEEVSLRNRTLFELDHAEEEWAKVTEFLIPQLDDFNVPVQEIKPMHFEKWLELSEYSYVRKEQLRKLHDKQECFDSRHAVMKCFIKKENLIKMTADIIVDTSPRPIQGNSDEYLIAASPWHKRFGNKMKETWTKDGPIYYTSGANAKDLGEWADIVEEKMQEQPGFFKLAEGDYRVYDGSQGLGLKSYKFKLYQQYVREHWHEIITYLESDINTRGVTMTGIRYKAKGRHGSGKPDTSTGNTQANVAALLWVASGGGKISILEMFEMGLLICVLGDDWAALVPKPLWSNFKSEEFNKLSLDIKLKWHDHISTLEFCSGLFYHTDNGRVWGPKIGRHLSKCNFRCLSDVNSSLSNMEWIQATRYAYYLNCTHIPGLRAMYDEVPDPKIKLRQLDFVPNNWHAHQMSSQCLIEMCERYNITPQHFDYMESILCKYKHQVIELDDPAFDILFEVDCAIEIKRQFGYELRMVTEDSTPPVLPILNLVRYVPTLAQAIGSILNFIINQVEQPMSEKVTVNVNESKKSNKGSKLSGNQQVALRREIRGDINRQVDQLKRQIRAIPTVAGAGDSKSVKTKARETLAMLNMFANPMGSNVVRLSTDSQKPTAITKPHVQFTAPWANGVAATNKQTLNPGEFVLVQFRDPRRGYIYYNPNTAAAVWSYSVKTLIASGYVANIPVPAQSNSTIQYTHATSTGAFAPHGQIAYPGMDAGGNTYFWIDSPDASSSWALSNLISTQTYIITTFQYYNGMVVNGANTSFTGNVGTSITVPNSGYWRINVESSGGGTCNITFGGSSSTFCHLPINGFTSNVAAIEEWRTIAASAMFSNRATELVVKGEIAGAQIDGDTDWTVAMGWNCLQVGQLSAGQVFTAITTNPANEYGFTAMKDGHYAFLKPEDVRDLTFKHLSILTNSTTSVPAPYPILCEDYLILVASLPASVSDPTQDLMVTLCWACEYTSNDQFREVKYANMLPTDQQNILFYTREMKQFHENPWHLSDIMSYARSHVLPIAESLANAVAAAVPHPMVKAIAGGIGAAAGMFKTSPQAKSHPPARKMLKQRRY